MRENTINILSKLKSFTENVIAGTDPEYNDTSPDKNRLKEIDKCLKWVASDGDLAFVSQQSGLLPCPFCGSEVHKGGNGNGQHIAKCYNCGVVMTHDRADKLEGMWNQRHKGNCG